MTAMNLTALPLVQWNFVCNKQVSRQNLVPIIGEDYLSKLVVNDESFVDSVICVNPSRQDQDGTSSSSTGIAILFQDNDNNQNKNVNDISNATLLETDSTIETLLQHFAVSNANAFVLEIWITPMSTTTTTTKLLQPIVTFGETTTTRDTIQPVDWIGCENYEIRLAQRGNILELSYTDNDPVQTCRILVIRNYPLRLNELTHIVILLKQGETQLYINGNPIILGAPNRYNTRLESWNPDYHLQLFSNLEATTSSTSSSSPSAIATDLGATFPGVIHALSIYDHALSLEQINQLYGMGLLEPPTEFPSISPTEPPSMEPSRKFLPIETPIDEMPVDNDDKNEDDSTSMPVDEAVSSFDDNTEPQSLYLVAGPSNHSLVVQGSSVPGVIWLNSLNASTSEYNIVFEIIKQPTHGNLLYPIDHQITENSNHILLPEMDISIEIAYEPFDDRYFNVPSVSAIGVDLGIPVDYLQYKIHAIDTITGETLGYSALVTQDIFVVHINHPPALITPQSTTPLPTEDHHHHQGQQQGGFATRPRSIVDNPIILDDTIDQDTNFVRVDVWAWNGTLTLNPEFHHLADFTNCSSRSFSQWQCHEGHRNITFVTVPSNVKFILSKLQHDAYPNKDNQGDEITVRAFDGAGGSCLDSIEHEQYYYHHHPNHPQQYTTIHNSCFQVSGTIIVPPWKDLLSVGVNGVSATTSGTGILKAIFDFRDFGLPDVIFWSIVILILIACCSIIRCIYDIVQRCLVRGNKVFPELDDEIPAVHVDLGLFEGDYEIEDDDDDEANAIDDNQAMGQPDNINIDDNSSIASTRINNVQDYINEQENQVGDVDDVILDGIDDNDDAAPDIML